jgi:hypothetical protein
MRSATYSGSHILPTAARVLCFSVVVLTAGALAAHAQDAKLELGSLQKLAAKAKEVTDVELDRPTLQLAQRFMGSDESSGDNEARQLLGQLSGIYIKSFEFDREGEYSQEDVDHILNQLHGAPWKRIAFYREEKSRENAGVYIARGGKAVKGLAIISAEPKELTVVNIVGSIDLEKLSALEGHFGIPHVKINPSGKEKGSGQVSPN